MGTRGKKRKRYEQSDADDGFFRYDRAAKYFRQQHNPADLPLNYVCKRCGMKADHFVYACKKRESSVREKCFFCYGTKKWSGHLLLLEDSHVYLSHSKGNYIREQFILTAKHHSSSINTFNNDLALQMVDRLKHAMKPKHLIIVDRNYGTHKFSHDFWEIFAVGESYVQKFKGLLQNQAKERGLRFGYLHPDLQVKDFTKAAKHLMFMFPSTQERLISIIPDHLESHLDVRWYGQLMAQTMDVEFLHWKTKQITLPREKDIALEIKSELQARLRDYQQILPVAFEQVSCLPASEI